MQLLNVCSCVDFTRCQLQNVLLQYVSLQYVVLQNDEYAKRARFLRVGGKLVYMTKRLSFCHSSKRSSSKTKNDMRGEPGGPKWREISLPVSPYFSYNLKFKSLYTFGYTVDLQAEISFFAMVHSTLQWFWLLCNFVLMLDETSLQVKIKYKPNTKNYISLIITKLKIFFFLMLNLLYFLKKHSEKVEKMFPRWLNTTEQVKQAGFGFQCCTFIFFITCLKTSYLNLNLKGQQKSTWYQSWTMTI